MSLLVIGIIIMLSPMILGVIYCIACDLYWFIKCRKEGGDWKYYGEHLALYLLTAVVLLGALIMYYGVYKMI